MPRELIAIAPRTPQLREYEELPLESHQIRIRTELASPKHGTELVSYRAENVARRYDAAWGAFVPVDPEGMGGFPFALGNMAVGIVSEIGPAVSRFAVGDRVFGHLPIRETHTVEETNVDSLPDGLSAEAAVCLDPAVMMMAMRDANIKLGDEVAVFGLGALGLMGVQLARIAGAATVIGVDPIEARREAAKQLGADITLDPTAGAGDAGLAIRRMTGLHHRVGPERPQRRRVIGGYWEIPSQHRQLGVDVAIESSGSIQALHHAIRSARFGGTICLISYYGQDAAGLRLGEEFHINQLQLVSSRVESLPLRDTPAWDLQRLVGVALGWLVSGRLSAAGILTPIVPFEQAEEAYWEIDEHPERSIKLGIRFE